MIEIKDKNGFNQEVETFSVLCDKFNGNDTDYVQMECFLDYNADYSESDNGELKLFGFRMDVWDNWLEKDGDYRPIDMNKEEFNQFVEFINRCHKIINSK